MKKYSAAIIGTGRIGFSLGFDKKREQPASHTMALLGNKSIKLVAAADINEANRKEWQDFVAKKQRSPAKPEIFSSSDELYKNVHGLDIITVAVNEDNHMEECLKAIEYKPRLVILEKPVALNSEEAKKIEDCAKANCVPVMVNHERRFAKDYMAARKLIGEIGDIQNVTAELDSGLRIYGKEFEKDGTYSLLHDGTHLVDIIQYILAPLCPKTVSENKGILLRSPTVTGIFKDEKGIIRNFSAHYSTKEIPEITIKMSGRSKFFEFRIEILGTLGKIIVGNGIAEFSLRKESKLYSGFYSLTRQKVNFPKRTGYFSGMIQNAVDFLNGESELVSPLEDAIADLKILEEIKANF